MTMQKLTTAQQELYDWLVQYINANQHAPSIRQMMVAMRLKSPAPIQSRLERLRRKGFIDWIDGKARTLRILQSQKPSEGVPILGLITAGGLVEPYSDEKNGHLLLGKVTNQADYFALKVVGDSMVESFIAEGDYAIMKKATDPDGIKDGTIVAARVAGEGTTLKHLYRESPEITILKPANSKYQPIKTDPRHLEIQGILVGVWRDCEYQ